MFYFWYIYLYRYYINNIKKIQKILRPFNSLVNSLFEKIFNKIDIRYWFSVLVKKTKVSSSAIAMIGFFVLAINLSLILSGMSKSFYTGLLGEVDIVVESIDVQEANAIENPVSVNDIDINSYLYYQNLNMEAKSDNFLDLYLIEDKNFLLRSTELIQFEMSLSRPDRIMTYVVKSGDSLGKIADNFGINVETIKTANSLKNNVINPGQELVILPISGIYYTVKKGDTLGGLAIKHKISASVISEYNGLEDDVLRIGQKIILPGAKTQVIVSTTKIPSKVYASNMTDGKQVSDTRTTESDFFIYPTVGWNWGTAHGVNNSAVDIANACGTPIYASADGVVIDVKSSGYNGGYGLYLKIRHNNGTSTLYAHLSKILVANGQYVSQGQLIGKMGTTGRSTGCHLHFEVHGTKNPFIKN
jgi:murein DD-endopeptidase MepM/ murein hydrolase activator NlpD